MFNESVGPLSLNPRQNKGQDINGQDLELWSTTYTWYYSNNGVPTANPVEVCQGTTNLNLWVSGKSLCTWTFVYQPGWGRVCNMYLFDQRCNVIGQNLGGVTLDDLNNTNGWGFASELPDYVVINIPSDPISGISNQVVFWYAGEEYMPWDFIPLNYKWLLDNNFSWSGTYGIFTVMRAAFAC
jgi:hypothetical protein